MRNLPKTFAELADIQFRWPKEGDRLLRQTDWDHGAGFSDNAFSRHIHIWDGYMSAGEALVEGLEQKSAGKAFSDLPNLFPVPPCCRTGDEMDSLEKRIHCDQWLVHVRRPRRDHSR
jgi:hypothetical protein